MFTYTHHLTTTSPPSHHHALQFNDPVAVRVPRDGTVDKMKTIVSKLASVAESELQLLRLMHGAQQPRADIFSDGSKRLQRDLNLYEGQVS